MSVSSSVAHKPAAGQSPSSAMTGSGLHSENDNSDDTGSENGSGDSGSDAAGSQDGSGDDYDGAAENEAGSDGEEPAAKRTRTEEHAVLAVEHGGLTYHVGDHVILEDPENSGGTQGTELPAVAQIHKLRQTPSGSEATVLWYVHPQLTAHPAYMEFYPDAVLRTFRQTTVPVSTLRQKCFVLLPADAMAGHPREWREGDRLFVCDARYVDKGGFIQKIKMRGFWPEEMTEERLHMVARPVPWPGGARQFEKAPVAVRGEGDEQGTPHTRRSTRLAATPASAAASVPDATPTMVPGGQVLALQQMLAQQQQQQQQAPPAFMLPGMTPASMQMPGSISGAIPPASPLSVMPIVPPRRRGRPPKNKQLIQKRAMEDAAAMAAAAQQQQHMSQMQVTPRRQPIGYAGRPPAPPTPVSSFSHAGMPAHSALATPQMLARSSPAIVPAVSQPRPQPPPRPVAIPYADAGAEPQLPDTVVSMFPTVNGRIKWFATAPVCQPASTHAHHSPEYMQWKHK